MDLALNGSDSRLEGYQPSKIPLDRALEMTATGGEAAIMCLNVTPATQTGKIELFSDEMEQRFGYGLPRYEKVQQDRPLTLITPSSSKRTNATFGHCSESQGPEELEMHPNDAAKRGLEDGQMVQAANDRATVSFKLKVTDATREGVLYSPKGTWRASSETGLTANALIPSDLRTDIEDGACYNETFVEVSAL